MKIKKFNILRDFAEINWSLKFFILSEWDNDFYQNVVQSSKAINWSVSKVIDFIM